MSITLRKAREYTAGLKILEEMHRTTPSWKSCIGLGYMVREMGDLEQAIQWFERAGEFSPPNMSYLLDAADTTLRAGYFQRALSHYNSILIAIPDNSWAEASIQYIYVRSLPM